MLDLKSLKVFLTVADVANMTVAAKRLGLSQSAVSQAVRQLEDSLGAVLIDRERRPLALTAAGVALRQRGDSLVAEAETLYKTVREQAGAQAQVLRIGMIDSFAATVGPPLIKSLLSSAVHIHVASGLSHDLGAALLERRLDMIVTTDPLEADVALERHRLLREPYVLLLPRALREAEREPSLASLAVAAPLVRFSSDSHIGVQIERYLRREGIVAPHRLEIDTADSLVAMVAAGIGWALITPLCLLQGRADPNAAVPLPLPGPGFGRELTLVSRRGEYGDLPQSIARSAAEIFVAEWRPALSRLAPWLTDAVIVD
ncbi:MAG TPA: LysR family transcriptional regulator [Casimicrobiaceae bacterium]